MASAFLVSFPPSLLSLSLCRQTDPTSRNSLVPELIQLIILRAIEPLSGAVSPSATLSLVLRPRKKSRKRGASPGDDGIGGRKGGNEKEEERGKRKGGRGDFYCEMFSRALLVPRAASELTGFGLRDSRESTLTPTTASIGRARDRLAVVNAY